MKKLTGPLLLAGALLIHMGIVIATEQDYTFSSSEYDHINTSTSGIIIAPVVYSGEPASGVNTTRFQPRYAIDEQSVPF